MPSRVRIEESIKMKIKIYVEIRWKLHRGWTKFSTVPLFFYFGQSLCGHQPEIQKQGNFRKCRVVCKGAVAYVCILVLKRVADNLSQTDQCEPKGTALLNPRVSRFENNVSVVPNPTVQSFRIQQTSRSESNDQVFRSATAQSFWIQQLSLSKSKGQVVLNPTVAGLSKSRGQVVLNLTS